MAERVGEELVEFQQAFDFLDKNGDGKISHDELGTVMRTLGRNITEDELQDMINEADADGTGTIDITEFAILMTKKLQDGDDVQDLETAFRAFDKTGTGYVSVEELRYMMTHIGTRLTEAEVEEMITQAHVNIHGQVRYSDLIHLLLR